MLTRLGSSRLDVLSLGPLDPAELLPLSAREDASYSLREGLRALAGTSYAHCSVVAQVVSRLRPCSTPTYSSVLLPLSPPPTSAPHLSGLPQHIGAGLGSGSSGGSSSGLHATGLRPLLQESSPETESLLCIDLTGLITLSNCRWIEKSLKDGVVLTAVGWG